MQIIPEKLPFAAILFDMDGVIVDSEPLHERAFREVFQELGYGDHHGIEFHQYLGRSDRALWDDFIIKHQPKQSLEFLSTLKQDRFLKIIDDLKPIFSDLPELVQRLARHYKLGLASGSLHPVIDAVLAMRNLRQFFPVRVSVQDVERSKPAPDVFLRAAELIGVSPSDCCVIEDSAAGVQAGKSAGMTVIAITNTLPREALSHADHVVSNYEEIDRLLLPITRTLCRT